MAAAAGSPALWDSSARRSTGISTTRAQTAEGVVQAQLMQLLGGLSEEDFLSMRRHFGDREEKRLSHHAFVDLCLQYATQGGLHSGQRGFAAGAAAFCEAVAGGRDFIDWPTLCAFLADAFASSGVRATASTVLGYEFQGTMQWARTTKDGRVGAMAYAPALHRAVALLGNAAALMAVRPGSAVEHRVVLASPLLAAAYSAPHEALLLGTADCRLWAFRFVYAAGAHHARATQAVLEHAVDSAVTALQVSPDGTLFWGTQAGDLCMGELITADAAGNGAGAGAHDRRRRPPKASDSAPTWTLVVHRRWPRLHTDVVKALVVLPGGRHVLTGSLDGTVVEVNLDLSYPVVHRGHRAGVHSIAYSDQLRMIFSAGFEFVIKGWELTQPGAATAALEDPIHPHSATLIGIVCVPGVPHLVSADVSGLVKVWDLQLMQRTHSFWAGGAGGPGRAGLVSLAYVPERQLLCLNSTTQSYLFQYEGVALQHSPAQLCRRDESVSACAVSVAGGVVAVAVGRGLKVFDLHTALLRTFFPQLLADPLVALCLPAEGDLLLAGTRKGDLAIVQVANGATLHTHHCFAAPVLFAAVAGRRGAVLAGTTQGSVAVWPSMRACQGQPPAQLCHGRRPLRGYSGPDFDGLLLLLLLDDGATWQAWALQEEELRPLQEHRDPEPGLDVLCLAALSPWPALCLGDGRGRLHLTALHPFLHGCRALAQWDARPGGPPAPASPRDADPARAPPPPSDAAGPAVGCLAFGAVRRRHLLFAGDEAGWIGVWDPVPVLLGADLEAPPQLLKRRRCPALRRDVRCAAAWRAHGDAVAALHLWPERGLLLSRGADGVVTLWDVAEEGRPVRVDDLRQCGPAGGLSLLGPAEEGPLPWDTASLGSEQPDPPSSRQRTGSSVVSFGDDAPPHHPAARGPPRGSRSVSLPPPDGPAEVMAPIPASDDSPSSSSTATSDSSDDQLEVNLAHLRRFRHTVAACPEQLCPVPRGSQRSPRRCDIDVPLAAVHPALATRTLRHVHPVTGAVRYAHVDPLAWPHAAPARHAAPPEGPLLRPAPVDPRRRPRGATRPRAGALAAAPATVLDAPDGDETGGVVPAGSGAAAGEGDEAALAAASLLELPPAPRRPPEATPLPAARPTRPPRAVIHRVPHATPEAESPPAPAPASPSPAAPTSPPRLPAAAADHGRPGVDAEPPAPPPDPFGPPGSAATAPHTSAGCRIPTGRSEERLPPPPPTSASRGRHPQTDPRGCATGPRMHRLRLRTGHLSRGPPVPVEPPPPPPPPPARPRPRRRRRPGTPAGHLRAAPAEFPSPPRSVSVGRSSCAIVHSGTPADSDPAGPPFCAAAHLSLHTTSYRRPRRRPPPPGLDGGDVPGGAGAGTGRPADSDTTLVPRDEEAPPSDGLAAAPPSPRRLFEMPPDCDIVSLESEGESSASLDGPAGREATTSEVVSETGDGGPEGDDAEEEGPEEGDGELERIRRAIQTVQEEMRAAPGLRWAAPALPTRGSLRSSKQRLGTPAPGADRWGADSAAKGAPQSPGFDFPARPAPLPRGRRSSAARNAGPAAMGFTARFPRQRAEKVLRDAPSPDGWSGPQPALSITGTSRQPEVGGAADPVTATVAYLMPKSRTVAVGVATSANAQRKREAYLKQRMRPPGTLSR